MSSRPTTPPDDTRKLPLDTSESQPTFQTTQPAATGLQGEMLATARYASYASYSRYPHHPTPEAHHVEHSKMSAPSEGVYAPPHSSLRSSTTLGAAQPASITLPSEGTQYHGTVSSNAESEPLKRTSSRPRRASALDESIGQSSTEAGPVEDETAPAPRKKRTRTLTTAHQSSVLLSLLARVRNFGGISHCSDAVL
jgi:hypothetical protein